MSEIPRIGEEPKARRHSWDDEKTVRFAAADTKSGCGETHRQCGDCSLIKVTVHPPNGQRPWLEFTLPGTRSRIALTTTPECLPRGGDVEKIKDEKPAVYR